MKTVFDKILLCYQENLGLLERAFMQIRKQQRHRKHMRTKETAFDKEKKIKGEMPSALYWGQQRFMYS